MTADQPNRDELGTLEGAELNDASVDELAAPTASATSIDEQIAKEKVRALRAANSYRRALVRWTLRTVGYLAISSTLFMGAYLWFQRGHVEASVMIAFFVSVVAETVGVLYVISQYLFPRDGIK